MGPPRDSRTGAQEEKFDRGAPGIRTMSDDEAQGEEKKLEDQYADELNDDDGFDEPFAKKAKAAPKPVWTLIVTLTFDSAERYQDKSYAYTVAHSYFEDAACFVGRK